MSYPKNKLQSNSRLDREGDYPADQSFNLPNLKYYTRDQAWDYLGSFDCTTRSLRQNMLYHYKARINYLSTLLESVHPNTINLVKDILALLELTFEYTVWYP